MNDPAQENSHLFNIFVNVKNQKQPSLIGKLIVLTGGDTQD